MLISYVMTLLNSFIYSRSFSLFADNMITYMEKYEGICKQGQFYFFFSNLCLLFPLIALSQCLELPSLHETCMMLAIAFCDMLFIKLSLFLYILNLLSYCCKRVWFLSNVVVKGYGFCQLYNHVVSFNLLRWILLFDF